MDLVVDGGVSVADDGAVQFRREIPRGGRHECRRQKRKGQWVA